VYASTPSCGPWGQAPDIFRLVLSESFLLCFLGVLPGVLAGAGFSALTVKLIDLALAAKGGALSVMISPSTLGLTCWGERCCRLAVPWCLRCRPPGGESSMRWIHSVEVRSLPLRHRTGR